MFGDPALRIKHHVGSGIEENLKPQSPGCRLSAVPNPCDATVRLSFSSSQQAGNCSRVAIYNACGRLIDSRAVRASSFDLRTSSFPAGVYLLRLQAGTHTTTNKLVVHHQAALAR
ncbi:MAG TPA: T9SS type A sorting domain-containing protein [bacterium]|nr:T9SS type A sorting domain-containing protein [bacterium]